MFYIEAVVINLHCLLDRMWNHPGGDIYGGGEIRVSEGILREN